MGVAEVDAEGARGIDARVHARQDEVLFGGRQREVALGEGRRVVARGLFDLLLDGGHGLGMSLSLSDRLLRLVYKG